MTGMVKENFKYVDQSFDEIQMLRYRLKDFDRLTLQQKIYIYCLSEATVAGRDIIFEQNGKYNLDIRHLLETIYVNYDGDRQIEDFKHFEVYLKRVWFSNGIYHHYNCDKFLPQCSRDYFTGLVESVAGFLSEKEHKDIDYYKNTILPVIFDPEILPKRVNKAENEDIVATSACNFYDNVTQQEVEDFYNAKKSNGDDRQPSWGLNTNVVKESGEIKEIVWKRGGMYGDSIDKIVYWLEKAVEYAENDKQKEVIGKLIRFYDTGDLHDFDDYSIAWTLAKEGKVDFINGFIEVYGDPLGMKATWEGLVEYIDEEATRRTETISKNAQWFEDNSPVDSRFKKERVKGVSAKVVCAAMLGGEEYPSSAIGINLPNANWIRAEYGSKSVTIGNLTEAYSEAAKGNGFRDEFIMDDDIRRLIDKYSVLTDDLHTDMHECLGHGSGKMLPNVDPDALKAYGNTIEEARADLFGLYYMADDKMIELGLLPDKEAYKAQYYSYMLNGLLTQLVRIKPGNKIEEAHMRNRALIAHWVLAHANGAVEMLKDESNGKTFIRINDYDKLRQLFAELLAEIQRIKSEGDIDAAQHLVEKFAVHIDADTHAEVLERYRKLHIAPYKGFINPRYTLVRDNSGKIVDVDVDYTETYEHQMMRYGKMNDVQQ